jgi:hypothetical protein
MPPIRIHDVRYVLCENTFQFKRRANGAMNATDHDASRARAGYQVEHHGDLPREVDVVHDVDVHRDVAESGVVCYGKGDHIP